MRAGTSPPPDPTVTVAIPGLEDGAGVDPTVGHADGDETVDSTIPSSLEGVNLAVPGGGRDRADSRVVLAVSPSLNIISPEELEVGDKLGEGGFGQVFRGTYYHTPVAVKVLYAPPVCGAGALSGCVGCGMWGAVCEVRYVEFVFVWWCHCAVRDVIWKSRESTLLASHRF